MTQFPLTRQDLEQITLLLAVGAVAFGALALWKRRGGGEWRRFAISGGTLGAAAVIATLLAYTVAPNIPTPPVPITARFTESPVPDTPENVAAGAATFQERCVICHGPEGRGDGPAAFTLNPRPVDLHLHVPRHAPGEIFYWISEGIPGTAMPAWKDTLSETERWQVVRFLYALVEGRTN